MLGTPHWSPDGKHIAFDARPDGHSAVYLIDLDSAASPRLLRRNRFEERMPSWSPDGTWLYFNSNANGSGRLFRVRVDGTGAEPVTSSVAYDSQVRADAIYFLGASTEVWRRQGNEESLLFPGIATRRYFTASERGLYFANNESNRAILFSPWGSKQAAEVARIPGALVVDTPSLSVSPDEKWLLFSQVDRVASDVWTVNLRVP
jgi:Tol biopolymer transport system component